MRRPRITPSMRAFKAMEAPVKATIIFLSGIAAAATGAFIRSCIMGDTPTVFADAWCGPAMSSGAPHTHCAGCALLVAGLVVMAAAPFFGRERGRRQAANAGKGCC